ncbi:hypothetical protein GLAREA_04888 [Glarea lozoyensis ATCC 20868]|uniref:Uncharacterized protein n=1 Tax=Glarea lozoyensis (strain ATCC 20868 / MF5171) TaxID=1116229 RepID=S3CNK9_GLAL2|nr:uncharacterized protein GLAREA_04888 [Glarea lozoyensis ATCC 20868]EPE28097.1 hypothetical protein GLAREA_04888 [Glarea lozoyensis ATCC 20868]
MKMQQLGAMLLAASSALAAPHDEPLSVLVTPTSTFSPTVVNTYPATSLLEESTQAKVQKPSWTIAYTPDCIDKPTQEAMHATTTHIVVTPTAAVAPTPMPEAKNADCRRQASDNPPREQVKDTSPLIEALSSSHRLPRRRPMRRHRSHMHMARSPPNSGETDPLNQGSTRDTTRILSGRQPSHPHGSHTHMAHGPANSGPNPTHQGTTRDENVADKTTYEKLARWLHPSKCYFSHCKGTRSEIDHAEEK